MKFAIVDIETTGGTPESSAIIEIAIIIHNGKKTVKRFSSLVDPGCSIPYFITQHTGITDEMVSGAPPFHAIAKEIIELTEGAVFVAHNVKFDYRFVKAAFKNLGYSYQRKTVCTVRLSRSTFPGLPSYSLGNLCESLDIPIKERHRAMGDAEATAILFSKILENNDTVLTADGLPTEIKRSLLPPLLHESVIEKIPYETTGVYYFYDQSGNILYIGKSNDIRKRILQHFASQKRSKELRLLHEIADISFENTGSELVALLLESDEIKKFKPPYNSAQKRGRAVPYYGIYQRIDPSGYINLFFEKLIPGEEPLVMIDSPFEAKNILYKAIDRYNLCESKCDLHKTGGPCFNHQIHKCLGACVDEEDPERYNERAAKAIDHFSFRNESFFIIDSGRNETEQSIILIERGEYKGFGYIDHSMNEPSLDSIRDCIKKYNHNKDIQKILRGFMKKGVKKFRIAIDN